MEENSQNTFSKRTWTIILVIGLIGLVLLLRNHTSHLLIALPYIVLLACPLMHIFMHGGHEHGK